MSDRIPAAELRARGVDASLGGTSILRHVALQASAGSVVGLLGPNGSGKSTLLRTCFRALRLDRGQIDVDGESIEGWSTRQIAQRIAVVLQDMPADFPLTGLDVVRMGRSTHKRAMERETAGDRAICAAALQILQASELATKPFTALSGGERQRILIARALAQQPQILLMDEPTNHLDLHHQLELLELITALEVTSVVALHDLNLAARYCDHLVLLRAGEVVASGTPYDVLTPELIGEVYRVSAQIIEHPTTGRPHIIPL